MSIHSESHPRRLRAVTRRMVALVALAIAVLFALPAIAGTLHTTDDAGVLTQSQLATVRSRAQGYDFDVRLITSSSYTSKSDLGGYVHRFVTEPNIVVIGLDPVHRHVSVHFGTGTRIADSEFSAIESAGVASFKDGDWAGGVVAILDRAEKAVGTGGGQRTSAVGTSASTSPSTGSSGLGGFFWIIVIAAGAGILFWVVSRRRSSGPQPMGGYGGPPVGGYGGPPVGGYGGPPVGGYGGPPVGPSYGGGGSGLGTNIAAAGLGGLVGYELGKEVGEGHHHRYEDGDVGPRLHEGRGGEEPPREWNGGGDSAEPGNYDAGGASGGWDDSSGGGSSDGDGGGDSGGGDSGGGGGDADF